MKFLLSLLTLLAAGPGAQAATGYRCELDDQAMLYHSTGRYADWGKRQVTQKCQELSQNPSRCRFRGCRKVQISAAWARESDRARANLNREVKQIYANAARGKRRQESVRRQPEVDTSFIDEAIRRRDEFDRVDREKRIDEFLKRHERKW
jgi:hypothetical protein